MKCIKILLKIEKSCFPIGKYWRENISIYNIISASKQQKDMEDCPDNKSVYPLDMLYNNKTFSEDPISKVCLF